MSSPKYPQQPVIYPQGFSQQICPGCSRQVPPGCMQCPSCGRPIAQIRKGMESWLIAVIVVVVLVVILVPIVLTSILYFMVIGISDGGTQTPAGVFTKCENTGVSTEKIFLGSFNPETKWSDCKLIVENLTSGAVNYTSTWMLDMILPSGTVYCTQVSGGDAGVSLVGQDLAGDGKISNGDYFTMTSHSTIGFVSNAMYKCTMLYIPTGSAICEKGFSR